MDALFIKLVGRPFFNGDSALRAGPQTSTQPIAQFLGHQPGFAIDDPQRPFSAIGNAVAAAIALFLVNANDLSGRFGCHDGKYGRNQSGLP